MGVATAVAIGGLAISAATSVKSFADANKSRKLQREAEADAAKAMAEARKKLEVNVYDTLAVQKEPYEREREALLAQGAQAIDAAQQGESRGVAATAGRIQMAQNEAQADVREAMGKEMQDISKLQADEESRLRDLNVQLDVGEAEGAQMAAANYQQQAASQEAQGWESAAGALQQGLSILPLYSGGGKTGPGADGASLSKKSMRMARKEVKTAPLAGKPQLNVAAMPKMNTQITPTVPWYSTIDWTNIGRR